MRRAIYVEAVIVDAVDRETVEARAVSADRAARAQDSSLLGRRAWGVHGEFLHVTTQSVDRQLIHDPAAKRSAKFRRLRFHQFGSGGHFDNRGDVAYFQHGRGFRRLVGFNDNPCRDGFLESGFLDANFIAAHQQIREYIRSSAGGVGGSGYVRGLVCNGDSGVFHAGTAFVGDRNAERAVETLRLRYGCREDARQH